MTCSFRSEHPDHVVVSYINRTAAVKQSDLICTSSNAVDLVNQLPPDQPVLALTRTRAAGTAAERRDLSLKQLMHRSRNLQRRSRACP